jgi:hypothetical protein
LRAAISDPNHPQHEEMLEWVGGAFDPEDCDAAGFVVAGGGLASLFR